jgi:hypothetical protein
MGMIRTFVFTVLAGTSVITHAMADEAQGKAKAESKIAPAKVERFSPSFVRWIENSRPLTSTKTGEPWISGDVGVRVLVIRR